MMPSSSASERWLNYLGIALGGPATAVFLGLLLAGIAELSTLTLLLDGVAFLLPAGRFLGFAWLIVVGFLLPRTRRRTQP